MRRIRFLVLTLGWCLAFTVCSVADVVTQPLRKFGLGDLWQVAISPDGQWMATSGGGGAFLWDFQTGTMLHRLEAHHRRVLALSFSADSQVLLTGGGDAVVRAWDGAHLVVGYGRTAAHALRARAILHKGQVCAGRQPDGDL
jgi:WD domain, G-beta repeat